VKVELDDDKVDLNEEDDTIAVVGMSVFVFSSV
jgi:hypothetical protein